VFGTGESDKYPQNHTDGITKFNATLIGSSRSGDGTGCQTDPKQTRITSRQELPGTGNSERHQECDPLLVPVHGHAHVTLPLVKLGQAD
jgi:hypothetical protein